MTLGTFDLLHKGHRNLFGKCLELKPDEFHIGVNTDRFVLQYKGIQPHESQKVRVRKCSAFGEAFLHDDRAHEDLLERHVTHLVVGSDWARKDYLRQISVTQDWLDDKGISVMYVPHTRGISSTQLRALRG